MIREIDIIIVNYNSTDYLLKCIDSIFENKEDLKLNLFVVDNYSKDRPERILETYPVIHYIAHGQNIGFSKAVNKALKICKAQWVFLINPDTIVRKYFFSTILSYLNDCPEVGILGPKILNPDLSVQGSARAFPNAFTALFGRTSILSKVFPGNRVTLKNIITLQQNHDEVLKVDWVSGGCMVVNQSAIRSVGLLDEQFFMYWEDADWCRRMREKNFEVIYFPKASIIHIGGQSSNSNFIRSRYEFHKSCYKLYFKYAPYNFFIKPVALFGLAVRFICVSFLNTRWFKIVFRRTR